MNAPALTASWADETLLARLPDDASVRELMRPFASLLDNEDVTELVINRPQRVLTETHLGWHAFDYRDLDFERMMSFAVAIATLTNQEVSAENPVLSALLPGDARIQIVVPPVVPPRTVSVTIRRPSSREKTLGIYRAEGLFNHTSWQRPAGPGGATKVLRATGPRLARRLGSRHFASLFGTPVAGRLSIGIRRQARAGTDDVS